MLIGVLWKSSAHGDRTGTQLVLDSGAESAEALALLLDRFDTASLGVQYNPANFPINGFDPYQAARLPNRRILNTHAKDARTISPNRLQEIPLGHGSIDWLLMFAVFEEFECCGYLTVAPEHSNSPDAEVTAPMPFLQRFLRRDCYQRPSQNKAWSCRSFHCQPWRHPQQIIRILRSFGGEG